MSEYIWRLAETAESFAEYFDNCEHSANLVQTNSKRIELMNKYILRLAETTESFAECFCVASK